MSAAERGKSSVEAKSSGVESEVVGAQDALISENLFTGEVENEVTVARPDITDPVLTDNNGQRIKIPIVGYEVMEERAKFTVFKLRIESGNPENYWFVFRRYTDFMRLHARLKEDFPDIILPLPKKKWFGNNFNINFLNERIDGLQEMIEAILSQNTLMTATHVRDFFCLDEPPSATDNVEETKAVVESLEERMFQLQRQLKEKEVAYERLKAAHSVEISAKLRLAGFIQECTKQCTSCASKLAALGQITP